MLVAVPHLECVIFWREIAVAERVILEHFGEQPRGNIVKHNCCDVCAAACACLDGGCQDKPDFEITLSKALTSSKISGAEELLLNIPTAKTVDKLQSALED